MALVFAEVEILVREENRVLLEQLLCVWLLHLAFARKKRVVED